MLSKQNKTNLHVHLFAAFICFNLDEGDNKLYFCDRELTVHVAISKTKEVNIMYKT